METVLINGKYGVETGLLIDEGPLSFQVRKFAVYLDTWDIEHYECDICDEDGKDPENWEADWTLTVKMAREEELEWLIDLEERMFDALNDHTPHPYHFTRRDGCIFLELVDEDDYTLVTPTQIKGD